MAKFSGILSGASALVLLATAVKADITLKNDGENELALSIYNNVALVQDTREVRLPSGKSSVLFSGVSAQLKPESVIVNADNMTVREQNYNFAMLSPQNVAKENIGKIVKTVIWDEDKGRNVYDKARIVDVYAGRPVLQFGYGIEFDFPGRIIWDSLPENLQSEPSLSLGVEAPESGSRKLSLLYLTGGLQWTTNYVAEFVSENELNLKAWVGINNTSGIDYNKAKVQLVAGEANIVSQDAARPMLMMKAARNAYMAETAVGASMPQEEAVGEYHVYPLPEKITIADNQTKQVSLLNKDKIKFAKEYRLVSPLYMAVSTNGDSFKKQNTEVVVKLVNNNESNLGEPLPQGVMRFYDRDSRGNMLFAGEASFKPLAVGEESELSVGTSFDVTASGKILSVNKVADNTSEAEVSVSFMNAKNTAVKVAFEQNLYDDWKIVSENINSVKVDAHKARWEVEVPAQGSAVLNFKVRFVKINA